MTQRRFIVEPRGLASIRLSIAVPVLSVLAALVVGGIFLALTGENEEPLRCNETNKFSILLTTHGGRATYTALLEAKRNKYLVRVEGTNGCKFFWKAEDVLDLTV